eukprot:TRINITY_DN3953_c0_g2_i1.p1 TRINITY_DN3953_c0_g2~~TRINITY_DN3953_c0_g2_i1.p1  ORF type:complete len:378 (+),score=71.16 TRINITY_DN3953_c0_g2_i1:48-1181(+)
MGNSVGGEVSREGLGYDMTVYFPPDGSPENTMRRSSFSFGGSNDGRDMPSLRVEGRFDRIPPTSIPPSFERDSPDVLRVRMDSYATSNEYFDLFDKLRVREEDIPKALNVYPKLIIQGFNYSSSPDTNRRRVIQEKVIRDMQGNPEFSPDRFMNGRSKYDVSMRVDVDPNRREELLRGMPSTVIVETPRRANLDRYFDENRVSAEKLNRTGDRNFYRVKLDFSRNGGSDVFMNDVKNILRNTGGESPRRFDPLPGRDFTPERRQSYFGSTTGPTYSPPTDMRGQTMDKRVLTDYSRDNQPSRLSRAGDTIPITESLRFSSPQRTSLTIDTGEANRTSGFVRPFNPENTDIQNGSRTDFSKYSLRVSDTRHSPDKSDH